jgi:cyclic pyranopterin phosphate synthase
MSALIDKYNRKIEYIRISVTDRCDLKCLYCKPKDSDSLSKRRAILRFEEIARIVRCFADMGVSRIRITGGEPLVRKDIASLINQLSHINGINDLAMTTNATLLSKYAADLKEAGLKRVNISLDTLNPETFKIVCGNGELNNVLEGIREAANIGLTPVNLNTVVMRGLNDNELIDIVHFAIENRANTRFIECMPVRRIVSLSKDRFISVKEIKTLVESHFELEPAHSSGGGPASYFKIKGEAIKIGFISPITQHFCGSCNRVRLTAEGILRLCLGYKDGIDLRDYIRSGISDESLKEIIVKIIQNKPQGHQFSEDKCIPIEQSMSTIGG